jgi:hypothetical protein
MGYYQGNFIMRKIPKFQVKKEVIIKLGERVFIDDVEWKVAEVIDDIVTLYRDAVGGESHTNYKTIKDVKSLLLKKA